MAADLAVVGATIRTLDPERPCATAVAIEKGTIVAVGDDASVRAVCDGATTLIDGAGMHIVPGLTDPHFHPFLSTDQAIGADLSGVRTLDELRAALAEEHRRVGPDGWVRGWGLVFEVFAETEIRGDLFADAAGGAPTLLMFFDFHSAVASPSALALAGVTGRERFSDFSTVVVDELGAPTGELREMSAMELVRQRISARTPEERHRRYLENMRIWNSLGLTGLHVMDGKPEIYELMRTLEANGDLTLRMRVPLWLEPEMTLEEMRAWLPLKNERGRRWRGGSAKFFIDGTIEGGTAWLIEPDAEGAGQVPFWPDPAHYTAAVKLFAGAGFQCVTHAVGDMAVRHTLNAYEAAGPVPGAMHRVEHIEVLQDEDLPRFAQLGVAASMQPLHMAMFQADGTDEWSRLVGPERRKLAFRTRDLLESGAVLALGSDWGVAPYDPRLGMAWCRVRRTPGCPDAAPIEPRQALTGLETLAGYTAAAATIVGDGGVAGVIKEGARGDLSAFAADLVEANPDDLLSIPTRLTIVDGEVVFQAE